MKRRRVNCNIGILLLREKRKEERSVRETWRDEKKEKKQSGLGGKGTLAKKHIQTGLTDKHTHKTVLAPETLLLLCASGFG